MTMSRQNVPADLAYLRTSAVVPLARSVRSKRHTSAALPALLTGWLWQSVDRGLSTTEKRDMTACTQPGCTGTTVDGYCDVCGSPAAAVPFVLAETAALAASAASADEPGLAAVPTPMPAPAHVAEEMPTQRIPRVKVPTQQLSAAEMADPEAADSAAVEEEMPTSRSSGEGADTAVVIRS